MRQERQVVSCSLRPPLDARTQPQRWRRHRAAAITFQARWHRQPPAVGLLVVAVVVVAVVVVVVAVVVVVVVAVVVVVVAVVVEVVVVVVASRHSSGMHDSVTTHNVVLIVIAPNTHYATRHETRGYAELAACAPPPPDIMRTSSAESTDTHSENVMCWLSYGSTRFTSVSRSASVFSGSIERTRSRNSPAPSDHTRHNPQQQVSRP